MRSSTWQGPAAEGRTADRPAAEDGASGRPIVEDGAADRSDPEDPPAAPGGTVVVRVNGEAVTLAAGTTVEELVLALRPDLGVDGRPRGVAVAIDETVLPRSLWAGTVVESRHGIEVVGAVQGG